MELEKNDNKQKEARIGPYLKKSWMKDKFTCLVKYKQVKQEVRWLSYFICWDSTDLLKLSEEQIYAFSQIQTSQTGGQLYSDRNFPLWNKFVLSGIKPIPIIIDLHLPSFTGITMDSILQPSIEIIVYKKREHDFKKSIDKSNTLGLC